jgi:hypothetical protein
MCIASRLRSMNGGCVTYPGPYHISSSRLTCSGPYKMHLGLYKHILILTVKRFNLVLVVGLQLMLQKLLNPFFHPMEVLVYKLVLQFIVDCDAPNPGNIPNTAHAPSPFYTWTYILIISSIIITIIATLESFFVL